MNAKQANFIRCEKLHQFLREKEIQIQACCFQSCLFGGDKILSSFKFCLFNSLQLLLNNVHPTESICNFRNKNFSFNLFFHIKHILLILHLHEPCHFMTWHIPFGILYYLILAMLKI